MTTGTRRPSREPDASSPGDWWLSRRCVATLLALRLLAPASLHAHAEGSVLPHELFRAWTLDPWVLLGVFLPAWLYARGTRRLWAQAGVGRGVRPWQAWCFAAGVVMLCLALISPLDSLGGTLFSAHMLQHMVLMLVAAPLMVVGAPLIPFAWALPMGWRRRIGGWTRDPDVRGVWYVVSNPLAAWLLHATAIWFWHVPVLYQATLYSDLVHFLQHIAFFGTALLFWWAALEFGRRQRLRYGFGALYVFTTGLHTSILGALLTFSMAIWYPIYSDRTAGWGLTPLQDQQLGGLLMWIPAGMVYIAAALGLLALGLGLAAREEAKCDASRLPTGTDVWSGSWLRLTSLSTMPASTCRERPRSKRSSSGFQSPRGRATGE